MSEAINLTEEEGLVKPLGKANRLGRFEEPAGIGYKIVVFDMTTSNPTLYRLLEPGESLPPREAIFKNLIGFAVDTRSHRKTGVEEEFLIGDRVTKTPLKIRLYYSVTNPVLVATDFDSDPLGKLCDEVIGTLSREMTKYDYDAISERLCEKVIGDLGEITHLGLKVEKGNVRYELPEEIAQRIKATVGSKFKADLRIQEIQDEERITRQRQAKELAEIQAEKQKHETKMEEESAKAALELKRELAEEMLRLVPATIRDYAEKSLDDATEIKEVREIFQLIFDVMMSLSEDLVTPPLLQERIREEPPKSAPAEGGEKGE
jgi:hypothetical protein